MPKSKSNVKSKSRPSYAVGGGGHMVGKTGASPQKAGTTSGSSHGSMGGKIKAGGKGRMVGKQSATAAKPL